LPDRPSGIFLRNRLDDPNHLERTAINTRRRNRGGWVERRDWARILAH
jgi:hypothetical protein